MKAVSMLCVLACMLAATANAQCQQPTPNPAAQINIREYCRPQTPAQYDCEKLRNADGSGNCDYDNCVKCTRLGDARSVNVCLGCVKGVLTTSLSKDNKCNLGNRCVNVGGNIFKSQCICAIAQAPAQTPPAVNTADITNFADRCQQCRSSPACACVVDLAKATYGFGNAVGCTDSVCSASKYSCPAGYSTTDANYCDIYNGACNNNYHPYYGGLCVKNGCGFVSGCNGNGGCLVASTPSGGTACIQNYPPPCGPTVSGGSPLHPPCLSDNDCPLGQACTCSWCGSNGGNVGYVCAPKC